MVETIIGSAVGILGNYIATATQPPIPNPWQQRLEQQQADAAAQHLAQTAMRPFREEVSRACRKLSRDRVGGHNLSPTEREIWLLLSHADFQTAFADWLMAGGIEEGRQLRAHLEAEMEQALRRGGATDAQIATFKADYFAALERAIFANPLLAAWRHQRSLDYLREQIDAVRQAAEQAAGIYSPQERQAALERYLEQALREWDIVDLSNLPEGDIHIATQRLLLRQLYMPLRVTVEVERGHATATAFDNLESQRAARRRREAGWSLPDNAGAAVNPQARVPVGERLGAAHRLVVLGDPGGGKTTLLRWMATAYLLRYQDDPAYGHLPDVATLPEARRLPLLIRCRDLGEADLSRSFTDVLAQHLLKTELRPEDAAVIRAMILERIATGEVLLLVDGLDEITNPQVRVQFCQELERTAARYPNAPIIVTSRIVGYRDMPYRMGAGFEHGVIADLTHADKDLFARRWIELTDQHLPQRERDARTDDLIRALHSSDRIERLTGNPMLLTTLALVKRKVGKLPSRRNKLYAEAVAVLLNWNPRHYDTIDEAEAIPQLAYVAYEMGRRGVQRLDADDILTLFEQVRQDYPNVRAMRRRSPEAFLALLEARSSILIKSGGSWRDEQRREEPVWEFRHLTLQEYLAARALLDGRYPGRNRQHRLAQEIAPLAGTFKEVLTGRGETELEVSDSWQETLRLLVADARDDDVDEVLLAILEPMEGEDPEQTARPRAALAARCLADEPDIAEETARQVLETFVAQVRENDGGGSIRTSVTRAAVEIGYSLWTGLLEACLLEEFFRRNATDRKPYGSLCAMIVGNFALETPERLSTWLSDCVVRMRTTDDRTIARSVLAIMHIAFKDRIVAVPGLVDALLLLIRRAEPVRMAAAWALWWLSQPGKTPGIVKPFVWQPARAEIERLVAVLQSIPDLHDDTARFLIYTLRNSAAPQAVELLLGDFDNPSAGVRQAAVEALVRITDTRAIDFLLARLDDFDAEVQLTAAAALGRHNHLQGIQVLAAAFSDPDSDRRTMAVQAFAVVRDRTTGRLLSHDLDALAPWLDPATPITMQRVKAAATALEMSVAEVQARYEALAGELPLILEWRTPAGEEPPAAGE